MVGRSRACGDTIRKLFQDKWSEASFNTPGMCSIVREISKCAVKNQRHRSRCITKGSLEDPLDTAATTPILSH